MPSPSKQFGLPFKLKKDYSKLSKQESRYGIPIKSAKETGLDNWFKQNTDTAGMVWGNGNNGSSPDEPLSIVVNPYNEYMKNEKNREGLFKNEASRIVMSNNPVPAYKISPQLQAWREKTFNKEDAYFKNDDAFRETVVARILTGDTGPDLKNPMPFDAEPRELASKYNQILSSMGKTNKLKKQFK